MCFIPFLMPLQGKTVQPEWYGSIENFQNIEPSPDKTLVQSKGVLPVFTESGITHLGLNGSVKDQNRYQNRTFCTKQRRHVLRAIWQTHY